MAYRLTTEKHLPTNAECPVCGPGTSVLYKRGVLTCQNCDFVLTSSAKRKNKYGAIKTVANDGQKRDSKFEASVADELLMRKQAGDILDYDSQYKVVLNIYDEDGMVAFTKNWKVDFRVHEKDGSFTLLEAKGMEGDDYKWKRDILTYVWLKENPNYEYEVRKQNSYSKKRRK